MCYQRGDRALRLINTGTSYGEEDIFDLTKMEPYNLDKLYKSFTKYSKELVLYLPRNSDLNQIAKYVPEDRKLEIAHYAIMGASKVCNVDVVEMQDTDFVQALCAYFGDFNFDVGEEEQEE